MIWKTVHSANTCFFGDTRRHREPALAFCGCVWCHDTNLNYPVSQTVHSLPLRHMECPFLRDALESSSFSPWIFFSAFKNLVSEKSDQTILFFFLLLYPGPPIVFIKVSVKGLQTLLILYQGQLRDFSVFYQVCIVSVMRLDASW